MAKELPYFQFEPAEYMSGSIQFCSLGAQGLFVNIMAIYWQRNCELTIDQINNRWGKPELLKELIDHKIVKIIPKKNGEAFEYIEIIFLKRSQKKHLSIARKNSINGKISAEKKRLKRSDTLPFNVANDRSTTVEKPLQRNFNETSTIRRDNIREEENREDNKINIKIFKKPTQKEVEDYLFLKHGEIEVEKINEVAGAFFDHFTANGWVVGKAKSPMKDWQAAVRNWLRMEKKYNQNGTTNEKPERKFGRLSESSIRNVFNRPDLPLPD